MKRLRVVYLSTLIIALACLFSAAHAAGKPDNPGPPATRSSWVALMNDPRVNFYDVEREFNRYWDTRPVEERNIRGSGWKQFHRWAEYMKPRVFPSGERYHASRSWPEYQRYLNQRGAGGAEFSVFSAASATGLGSWTSLDPAGPPPAATTPGPTTYNYGAGRLNFIRVMPGNSNTLFAGAPAGGLWKSTNAGSSWATTTDQLAIIGVSDLAINPTNTNIMYLATGDGDYATQRSIGVLKSIDGGVTWNPTGLTWTVEQGIIMRRLLIHPTSPSILLAATSDGIYRTADSGATWTRVQTGEFKDIEFKPGNPKIVYAAHREFYRSTNTGTSFQKITSGLPPLSSVSRMEIAVTPAATGYVYIVAGNSSYSGFLGFYRSTNSGSSFTARATTPNILGYADDGSPCQFPENPQAYCGQAWYDLAIAASPTNKDQVFVGGIKVWRTNDGGTNWNISFPYDNQSVPGARPHFDIHDLIYLNGTTLYAASDGGVHKFTNLSTWDDITANLKIGQIYRLGGSATDPNLILSGWQDNGTYLYSLPYVWVSIGGGDGMECFVDSSTSTLYFSYQGGAFTRIKDGVYAGISVNPPVAEPAAWTTPWTLDPVNKMQLYAGLANVYKSDNQGDNWSLIGTIAPSNIPISDLAVAPSDSNYIYVIKEDRRIHRTINGGATWTDITSNLPVSLAQPSKIVVHDQAPNIAWVAFYGYDATTKVYVTINGGSNWYNISSATLPNIPINTMAFQSSMNRLYVGADIGVYFTTDPYSGGQPWQSFANGLPNTVVKEIEIHYATGKLRAATHGRGMWESPLAP